MWFRGWLIVDAAWYGWVESMNSNEEQIRAAIAEQASEWLVANDEGPLKACDSAALAAWLKTSPVHVEEFLGVSVLARDMRALGADPDFSVDSVVESARAEAASSVRPLWPRVVTPKRGISSRRWVPAIASLAAVVLVSLGLVSLWNAGFFAPASAPGEAPVRYQTGHGEQLSLRLNDNSVLHLNTDSAVSIRYGKAERLVTLLSGEADFEVTHDPGRAFRVLAGSAEIVDIGTKFDVRLEDESTVVTVVTVVEGRVAVGMHSGDDQTPRSVQLLANQQIRVTVADWPPTPATVDAQHATAWLHRQIVFDQEPLERVAAEFNRYSPKPIEIVTPTLRDLQISGVFATDDTEAFIAFLRSLKGVRVEVTATRIRVSRSTGVALRNYT
jgi:transmembrane sensor